MAKREYQELQTLAGDEKLEAWDLAYYSEKLQLSQFSFNQEDLRPYFPINKVLKGSVFRRGKALQHPY